MNSIQKLNYRRARAVRLVQAAISILRPNNPQEKKMIKELRKAERSIDATIIYFESKKKQ